MSRSTVRVASFTDPEELASAIPGVVFRATALRAGPFKASLATCRLGNLVLQTGSCSPSAAIATAGPATAALQLPLENRETLMLNGRIAGTRSVGLYGPGADMIRANPRPSTHAVLLMPADIVEELLCPPHGAGLFAANSARVRMSDPTAWDRIEAVATAAAAVMTDASETLAGDPARLGLRASLLDAARAVLAAGHEAEGHRRAQAWRNWRRVVIGVEAYLNGHATRPIYTEELCATLGVSAAGLAAAFQATLGISPHRYLKLRRLGMVRAALRARDCPVPLVKSVALGHGFWHLGQFAHDYRVMYGETPSETLARSRAWRGASDGVTAAETGIVDEPWAARRLTR